ncbi:SDR family oxidoreductase [bacterium]|nr:SDR family oxidoreductase [bacterium]
MYSGIQQKIALITGASRGFGRATALRLAREGATIILNYRRSTSEAQATADEIQALGAEVRLIKADIGDEEKITMMMDTVRSEFGRLDILVANASFGIPGSVLNAKSRYWDITMDATAKSLLLLSQHAVPLMANGGHIVVMTSYGHLRILPNYGVVGAAKGAVDALMKALAVELAPKGIIVNGVMPGLSPTKSLLAVPGADASVESVTARTPMGRLITPEEVANIVAFLVSGEADMIVGQLLLADGGAILV